MSLKEKLTNFFGLTDEEDYYEESVVAQESVRKSNEYIFTKPYAITASASAAFNSIKCVL